MSSLPSIGFLGGTGIEGRGLAARLAQAGVAVCLGSRLLKRAQEAAQRINELIGSELVRGAENEEMLCVSEVIFLTVPFEQAVVAIDTYRAKFRAGTILVDVTVPVAFAGGQVRYMSVAEGSGSQALAKRLPTGVELVGAFKTIPAHLLAELGAPLDCDVFVCGDSEPAKARVMEVIQRIPGLRPVDAGGLEAAGTPERMSVLAIGINRRYKIRSARFRVVGL